ncbi:MAG TPA: hypothetical protein DHW82_01230 [Spirochaetia bacterium]|nr:MAG: hypothetical protein A2Y41_04690 [Spirochaetes bacterium GWB1_36_13]HCL55619.1 hypothetical protein [Spirochaetia bacterium]
MNLNAHKDIFISSLKYRLKNLYSKEKKSVLFLNKDLKWELEKGFQDSCILLGCEFLDKKRCFEKFNQETGFKKCRKGMISFFHSISFNKQNEGYLVVGQYFSLKEKMKQKKISLPIINDKNKKYIYSQLIKMTHKIHTSGSDSMRNKQSDFFYHLSKKISGGFIQVDSEFKIIFSNSLIHKWFHIDQKKLKGMLIYDFFEGLVENLAVFKEKLMNLDKKKISFSVKDQNSERNYFFLRKIKDQDKEIYFFEKDNRGKQIAVLKEKLKKSEKIKKNFLANLNHELRTPLNGIIGLRRLLETTPLASDQKKYLEMMKCSGEILLNKINNLLELSLLEKGKYVKQEKKLKIKDLFREIKKLASDKNYKDLKIDFETYGNEEEEINADEKSIKKIIGHLIDNAVKYTDEGSIQIKIEKMEDALQFNISDTGIGIPKEKIAKIFTPFYQADLSSAKRHQGLGTGLSFVKKAVNMLHGKIKVESLEKQGTHIVCEIPCRNIDNQSDISKEKTDREEKMILIVDDNQVNSVFLSKLIEKKGYKTETAPSGFKAVEMLQNKKYSLVLLDIQMPGIDGFETAKRMRAVENKNNELVPIIFLSGYFGEEELKKGQSLGIEAYLSKPLDLEMLFDKIDEVLNGSL